MKSVVSLTYGSSDFAESCLHTLIHVSWAASGSLLKFPLYDFNDYDDDWARF